MGDPALRPDGLERALARGGFQVLEAELVPEGAPSADRPDLTLLTAASADEALAASLARLSNGAWAEVPVFAVLASANPDGAMAALQMGATEALNAPVHLGELCARITARLRGRPGGNGQAPDLGASAVALGLFDDAAAAIRPEELIEALVRRVGAALELAHCAFLVIPPGGSTGRVVSSEEGPVGRDVTVDLSRYPEVQEALRTGSPVYVPDIHADPRLAEARAAWEEQGIRVPVRSVLAIPVSLRGQTAGVFLLRTRLAEPPLAPSQVAFAEAVVAAAAKVLEAESRRSETFQRLAGASVHDPLTGCGTLEALDRRIREEFERARRYALSFSLILLDVDHLRDLNARLGREGGDRILAELGRLLQRELRVPDFVSRYGGDEFALILPETDLAGARRSVARVRERIQAAAFGDLPPGDRPRLSAGIVTYPHPSAGQSEDLFALVEAALLRGKAQADERIGTADITSG